jgi:hypothetical protein
MLSHFWKYGAAALIASALVMTPAFSQGKGKGKGHDKQDQGDNEGKHNKYEFGEHDREVITHYYSNRGSNLPPGLAKRGGNLPPGLEKQLERNGTLPPGLQKRVEPCPVELERQLPPLPAEYRRGVIGAHVVIFNRNTNVIVDVLKGVAY